MNARRMDCGEGGSTRREEGEKGDAEGVRVVSPDNADSRSGHWMMGAMAEEI